MNYIIADKHSNRAIALIEEGFKAWFEQNLKGFDIIEVENIGSSNITTDEGSISTISMFPKNKHFSKDAYHMISRFPDNINLAKAYELIK